jgi:hypothetical protein
MMTEPRVDDDVALDIYPVCDNCDKEHSDYDECSDSEPDRMWGDDD